MRTFLTSSVIALVLISGVVLPSASAPSRPQGRSELPCGVASVAVLLELLGDTRDYVDVENRFRELGMARRLNGLSMSDLQIVLEDLGYDYSAVRVSSFGDLGRSTTPAILFLQPTGTGSGDPIGHFIVLQNVDNGVATVIDLTTNSPLAEVPISELSRFWDGRALVPSQAWWRGAPTILLSIANVVLAISLIRTIRNGKPKKFESSPQKNDATSIPSPNRQPHPDSNRRVKTPEKGEY